MGWGDEIMAAGEAEVEAKKLGRPVAIVDRMARPRWSEIWVGNPWIDRNARDQILNAPGARPYIQYPFTPRGHKYTRWRARDHRAHIFFTDEEAISARPLARWMPFIVIEPNLKHPSNRNKAYDRWQAVVDLLPDMPWVQLVHDGTDVRLRGVEQMQSKSFRQACLILSHAAMFVGHEGGMHHAAAALNVGAVVYFGGSPSVEATGYPEHVNIAADEPCGRWDACPHCDAFRRDTSPELIAAHVAEQFDEYARRHVDD